MNDEHGINGNSYGNRHFAAHAEIGYVGRTVIITNEFIDYKRRTIGLTFSPKYKAGDAYQIMSVYGNGFLIAKEGETAVYCPLNFAADMLVK